VAASVAWAAPEVTGKIHSVDVVNDVVTLESGKYYLIPPAIKPDGLKAGDQVTMSVDNDQQGNGTNRAETLTKTN
jgi:hypothetical protein